MDIILYFCYNRKKQIYKKMNKIEKNYQTPLKLEIYRLVLPIRVVKFPGQTHAFLYHVWSRFWQCNILCLIQFGKNLVVEENGFCFTCIALLVS